MHTGELESYEQPATVVGMRPADKWLLFAVLSLMFMSLVIVYSASAFWAEIRFQNPAYFLKSHMFKVLAGVVLIFILAKFDYHKYQKLALLLIEISVALLVVAIGEHVVIKGAARWIHAGPFSFEPSDLAKVAILIFVAAHLSENSEKLGDRKSLYRPLAWTLIVVVLIGKQPNYSTAMIIAAIVGVLLFLGGARKSHLAILALIAIAAGAAFLMLESYRVARMKSWLDHGSGDYQVRQSIIGFGNGGILGVGPGNSKQRNLFLPEPYGDFIYSIIGEEYGLWGSVFVMLLFLFIAFRGTAIAKRAPDRFGFLLAGGITTMISLYAFINAGVALGIFPTTGLPMPLVSYGGTAMIVNAACIGILLNISKQIPETFGEHAVKVEKQKVRKKKNRGSDPVVGRIYS